MDPTTRIDNFLDYYTRDDGLKTAVRQYEQRHGFPPTSLLIRTGVVIPDEDVELANSLFVAHNSHIPADVFAFYLPRIRKQGEQLQLF